MALFLAWLRRGEPLFRPFFALGDVQEVRTMPLRIIEQVWRHLKKAIRYSRNRTSMGGVDLAYRDPR